MSETTKKAKKAQGFTAEEKAAMKERAKELKAAALGKDAEDAVIAKLAEMPEPDRSIGQKIHAIIKTNAPSLAPKLWYGMPAYANKDGKIVCFFQCAQKFETRYSTLGFNDTANLDDGAIWPVAYGLTEVTPAVEAKIAELVKKAVS